MEELKIYAAIQILKPVREVFEAIADPRRMSGYFIAESTGKMEEGIILEWKFPEFEKMFRIKVLKVLTDELISFEWEGILDKKTKVDIFLTKLPGNFTLVKIYEGKLPNNETGIKWYGQNTEGWANFLACLKAYLEYGINLRKGAFDFMK